MVYNLSFPPINDNQAYIVLSVFSKLWSAVMYDRVNLNGSDVLAHGFTPENLIHQNLELAWIFRAQQEPNTYTLQNRGTGRFLSYDINGGIIGSETEQSVWSVMPVIEPPENLLNIPHYQCCYMFVVPKNIQYKLALPANVANTELGSFDSDSPLHLYDALTKPTQSSYLKHMNPWMLTQCVGACD